MKYPCRLSVGRALLITGVLLAAARPALAQDPGLAYPATSEASDQKNGSILVYNLYTSSLTSPEDTRISITNNSNNSAAFMRMFFVDGTTGFAANATMCLTSEQTVSFNASDTLPGLRGYLIAVAVDGVLGCPVAFNQLSGNAEVRLAGGQVGTLGAIAFSALYAGSFPGCDANSITAALPLNGVSYNAAPRALQVPDIASPADGSSLLVVNRLSGNLTNSMPGIGNVFGNLWDDSENEHGFADLLPRPQHVEQLSNTFPLTAPNFGTVIPTGRSGWMKFWSTSDIGLVGSQFLLRSQSSTKGKRTTTTISPRGGINLRHITLSPASVLTVPVGSPSC